MKKVIFILVGIMVLAMSIAVAETAEKPLVVYYSATGTTERVGKVIADYTGADVFVIEPQVPYTEDDLDWRNPESRCVTEHEAGEEAIPLVSTEVPNWAEYTKVYIGYPIWWRDASWVMDTFVMENDFTGKTVVPFCTSMSSGYGESGENLAEKADRGNWVTGIGFYDDVEDAAILEWLGTGI